MGISIAAATSKALTHELFYEYADHETHMIGEAQLRVMVREMSTQNPGLSLPSKEEVKTVLRFLDRDGNNLIDENEFIAWLSNGATKSKQQRGKIAEKSPMHSRFINLLESVLRWLEPSNEKVEEIFTSAHHLSGRKTSSRDDGKPLGIDQLKDLVTAASHMLANEGLELPQSPTELKQLMNMIDDDHSGTIDSDEFVKWLQGGIAMMRALDGPARVKFAKKSPFNPKLINLYEALVDNWSTASKITHEFQAGPLGLTFRENKEGPNMENVVHVMNIKGGGAASECKELLVGDIITAVSGESVKGLQIAEIVKKIQKSKRPMRLCFRHIDHARRQLIAQEHQAVQKSPTRSRSIKTVNSQGMPQDEAVTKIQAAHRGKQARQELKERKEAATKIQAIQRGKQERNRVRETREELRDKEDAARKIQAVQRGRQERKDLKEREDAAVRIQAIQRGRQERASTREKESRQRVYKQTQKIRGVWKKMDRGNRGWVGPEDILKGFKLLGATTMTPQEARELSRFISKNGDGRVVQAEFEDYCRSSLGGNNSPRKPRGSPPVRWSPKPPRRSPAPPNPSPRLARGQLEPPRKQEVLTSLDVESAEMEDVEQVINLEPLKMEPIEASQMSPMEESFEKFQQFEDGPGSATMPQGSAPQTNSLSASRTGLTQKERMAARSRRVLRSLPPATQRELHAIHEVRSLTDTDRIPPSVLGNLHSLDPMAQVAACKRVQNMINQWVSAPLKDLLNEAIDWAEEQTYDDLISMNRRTPLAGPSFELQPTTHQKAIEESQRMAQNSLPGGNALAQSAGPINTESPKQAGGLSAIEAEKEERNNKIRSLDKDVRRELRSIHQIATVKNLSLDDLDRLAVLQKSRQMYVLKRTKALLLGEYQDERAEVVLRKALPSKRVARKQRMAGKKNTMSPSGARRNGAKSYASMGKGGAKTRKMGNRKGDAGFDSMGSHHSTVQPGYSYSPRHKGNPVPPAGRLPAQSQQPYNIGDNGYFTSQSPPQQNLAMSNGAFQGAVYYNEGSPVAVFAGQEASRAFPQYYAQSYYRR